VRPEGVPSSAPDRKPRGYSISGAFPCLRGVVLMGAVGCQTALVSPLFDHWVPVVVVYLWWGIQRHHWVVGSGLGGWAASLRQVRPESAPGADRRPCSGSGLPKGPSFRAPPIWQVAWLLD